MSGNSMIDGASELSTHDRHTTPLDDLDDLEGAAVATFVYNASDFLSLQPWLSRRHRRWETMSSEDRCRFALGWAPFPCFSFLRALVSSGSLHPDPMSFDPAVPVHSISFVSCSRHPWRMLIDCVVPTHLKGHRKPRIGEFHRGRRPTHDRHRHRVPLAPWRHRQPPSTCILAPK